MSGALDAALLLAAQGFPVFPCGRNKRPALKDGHGFQDATADPERIRAMFEQSGDLVGMPTGAITGFDVLDLDYRHGAKEWETENAYRLPETRIHQTQSGGRHYLFRHAPSVRNTAGKVAPGIDVRGDGGYIVAPPSEGYSVISDADIAEWPDWLLDLVLSKPPAPRVNGYHKPLEIESRRLEGFIRSISDRVRSAPEGSKHFQLRNAALSIGGIMEVAGLSENQATELLLHALPSTVKDWENANRTIAWGLQRGRERPLELEDRQDYRPQPETPPPDHSSDPGWWRSLEARVAEEPAEVRESGETSPKTSAKPPPEDAFVAEIIDPRDWTAPAPLREWIVQDWIPRGYVTGLYADGATGKSLIAQQLLTSVATVLPWLGMDVRGGNAYGMMCEDDDKELHRRQDAINAAYGLQAHHLEYMRLHPRLGFDNLLMTFDVQNVPHLTELFASLCSYLTQFPPTLVVLDTLSDIFGGNELSRNHARTFVQGVGGRIARHWNCGVVVLAHPSAAGLATKSGTAGSTAWNNTFRSRIYMTRPEDDEDGDTRLLSRMKANYAPKKGEITVEWKNGAFLPVGPGTRPATPKWQEISTEIITAIFDEIDRAWHAREAWSNAPQTEVHGRYLPLWIEVRLGLSKKQAGQCLNQWLAAGFLKSVEINAKTKERGLCVVRRPPQPRVGRKSGGGSK